MTLDTSKKVALWIAMAAGLAIPSAGPFAAPPIAARMMAVETLPIAIYRNIRFDALQALLVDSFTQSNFRFVGAKKSPDGVVEFEFAYPNGVAEKPGFVTYRFKVDGTIANGKCANCFLRWGQVPDEQSMGNLPWMAQYELSSRLYPDLDRAYASIRARSQDFIDPGHGFNRRNHWNGERNRLADSNSYVGIGLPELKGHITRAMTDSGFVLQRDGNPAPDAAAASLVFTYPIEAGKPEGATYTIQFASQFDAAGKCHPCEATPAYDPHQALPALGPMAIPARLTLATRFEASLAAAYDRMEAATQQYLRPRTRFARPPKAAALGTPRPPPMPMPVT